jgi:hypothetical protein
MSTNYNSFTPTQLEVAYASYLLSLGQDLIRLSGLSASVLDLIWHAASNDFASWLRLVAFAQQQPHQTIATREDALFVLQLQVDLPLAVFEGIRIPGAQELIETYGVCGQQQSSNVQQQHQMSLDNNDNNEHDSFGDFSSALQQQELSSGWDALDALAQDIQDAPLPLLTIGSTNSNSSDTGNANHNETQQSQPQSADSTTCTTGSTEWNVNTAELTNTTFEPVVPEPATVPSVMATLDQDCNFEAFTLKTSSDEDDDDDDFGDFVTHTQTDAPPGLQVAPNVPDQALPQQDVSMTIHSSVSSVEISKNNKSEAWDALDCLADSNVPPNPLRSLADTTAIDSDDDDDNNNNSSAITESAGNKDQSVLPAANEIPSVAPFQSFETADSSGFYSAKSEASDNVGMAVERVAMAVPLQALVDVEDDDPFAALAPVQPELPSLQSFGTSYDSTDLVTVHSDVLGGFGETEVLDMVSSTNVDARSMSNTGNQCLDTNDSSNEVPVFEDDDFGGFEGANTTDENDFTSDLGGFQSLATVDSNRFGVFEVTTGFADAGLTVAASAVDSLPSSPSGQDMLTGFESPYKFNVASVVSEEFSDFAAAIDTVSAYKTHGDTAVDYKDPDTHQHEASTPVIEDLCNGITDVQTPTCDDSFEDFAGAPSELPEEALEVDRGDAATGFIDLATDQPEASTTVGTDFFDGITVVQAPSNDALDDSFGGFTGAPAEFSDETRGNESDPQSVMQENSSATSATSSLPAPPFGGDMFGFEDPLQSALVATTNTVEDDEFGDFSDARATASAPTLVGDSADVHLDLQAAHDEPIPIAKLDDFGDIITEVQAPAPSDDAFNASFGDFVSEPAKVSVGTHDPPVVQVDDDADFGDFADFSSGSEPIVKSENPRDALERDRLATVKKLLTQESLRLPISMRLKAGSVADHVDFGDCFEYNIGMNVPVSEKRKKRAQRCLLLIGLLSNSHFKLASIYWQQALSITREELYGGVALLKEATILPAYELVTAKQALETYVHSLGEFVRVARSIVGTVGDLLMLDPSTLLTKETFDTSWCNLALLEDALQIEDHWVDLEQLSLSLNLASKQSSKQKLESLVEIRTTSSKSVVPRMCHFTLQPLAGVQTKTPVSWKGLPYMACAANFASHKCPSYSTT